MKFEKIWIPAESLVHKGLKEIKLNDKPLGNVVALVGKNGAGKSRVLKFVELYLDYMAADNFLDGYIGNIPNELVEKNRDRFIQADNLYKGYKEKKVAGNQTEAKSILNDARNRSRDLFVDIKKYLVEYITVVNNDEIKKIKNTLTNNITFESILKNGHINQPIVAKQPKLNVFTDLNSQATFNYLKTISDQIAQKEFNLYLENKNSTEFKKNPNIIDEKLSTHESYLLFAKFQKQVYNFLGKNFGYQATPNSNSIETTLSFDNHNFSLSELSPGERTLLAYAVLFFYIEINGSTNLNENIIIIDEPELHLHPDAQIKLLNALRDIVTDRGQLWIATHSIDILAHLNYDEIFMVKDSKVITPSRTIPGESLIELMGLEDYIGELENFITSTSQWAFANFMAQCFKDPEVLLNIDPKDSQYLLFKKYLKETKEIMLLDFGAGRGRIGLTLQDDSDLKNKINYVALEPDRSLHDIIRKIESVKDVYISTEVIADNVFDIVLLCNVLHEISPEFWVKELYGIKRILKNDGYILLLEDKQMPKGECAHKFGYLTLNSNQFKKLLKAENCLELESDNIAHKGRFTFCAIKKEQINPTHDSLISSIKDLKIDSYVQIKSIREQKKDVAQGRLYANLTQLYLNASITLDEFQKPKTIVDFFSGKWENEWAENGQTSSEICEINDEKQYFVDGKHVFNLKEIHVDPNENKISFVKEGIGQNENTILLNELNITSEDLIIGTEKDLKTEKERILQIKYRKIKN